MGIRILVDPRETVREHFTLKDKETGEEEACYLDLRAELSDFDRQTLALAAVKDTTMNDEGQPVFKIDAAKQRVLTRIAWIAGWSFDVPCNADSMERLRGHVATIIDDIVDKHASKAARRGRVVRDPKPSTSATAVVDFETARTA